MRPPTVAFMTTSGHAGSDGTAPGNEPANHAGENANIHIDPVAFPAPVNYFASDNAAGAHPDAIDAIVAANVGPALAFWSRPTTSMHWLAVSRPRWNRTLLPSR